MTDKELEKIYSEAYKSVYWTAMALLKNEADAEDVVQDTFISFIESYSDLTDTTKAVALLKKIAANKCLDRIKLSKTDTVEDEFFEDVEAVPEDFLPDSIVESADARKIVMDIIEKSLSDDIRRTLILFYFDEMSTKEIAGTLGVPEGTVRRRLNFARNKIKKEVGKYEEDNKTKLFGMALPFLSKLFMKEAEQVVFKPMPAKLISLSASSQASKAGAATKIAASAAKKGTGILMKTKILIGSIAAVVAVGTTVGVVLGVMNSKPKPEEVPEEEPAVTTEASVAEESEIAETDAQTTIDETTTEETTVAPVASDTWTDEAHCYINGKEIMLGLYGSTMQDLADSGCYIEIRTNGNSAFGIEEQFYTVDDEYDLSMLFTIYPDKASASSDVGGITLIVSPAPDMETPCSVKDCIIIGIIVKTENASAWGDKLGFDFPLTMTVDQLIENSGEPAQADESGYIYLSGLSFWNFEFDDNDQLISFSWHE